MPWQFFIVPYFVLAVSRELASRWFAKNSKLPTRVIAALSFTFGVLPFGLLVGFTSSDRNFNWDIKTLLLLVAVGGFIALFVWLSYSAKRLVNVTLSLTLHQVYVVVVALFGWLLLDEKLQGKQIVGGVILLAGAYLAIYSTKRNAHKGVSLKGAVLAFLGGLALGAGLVAEKAALNIISMSAYFIVGYGAQALGTVTVSLPALKTLKRADLTRFEVLGATGCGLLMAGGGYMYINMLTRVDNVAFVALLTTFNLPLSTIASHFILHERDNGWMLILAAAVSFIGLLITAL